MTERHEPDSSFETIYRENLAAVYHLCLWQMRNAAAAEDVTSQTFLYAYQVYQQRGLERETAGTWLLRAARSRVIDHYRKESRRARLLGLLGRSNQTGDDAEAVAETNAELDRIRAVLRTMKERDRTLVALRISGLRAKEIADVMGMTEINARVAALRAVERFRKLLGSLDGKAL